jgi:DNA polymerase-4
MDAFFASVEQAANPRLGGRPLIVGARENRLKTVVCAASYEAKKLGIASGMSSKEAFLICPNLEFVVADQSKYIYISERIYCMLFDYDPNPIYASIDEFQIDLRTITGVNKLRDISEEIRSRINAEFGITASVGIAKNCLLAKLASKINKPNGICILDEISLKKYLFNLPVEKLMGVGPGTRIYLNKIGVFSCWDFYNLSEEFLTAHLGKVGFNFYLGLHSADNFSLRPIIEKPKSIGHSYTLNQPTNNQEFIFSWVRLLAEMVSRRLREQNLAARTIHFSCDDALKKAYISRQKTFSSGTNDGQDITAKTVQIWADFGLKKPLLRCLGISCLGFTSIYRDLFKDVDKRQNLLKTTDKINRKFGEWTLMPASIINVSGNVKNATK